MSDCKIHGPNWMDLVSMSPDGSGCDENCWLCYTLDQLNDAGKNVFAARIRQAKEQGARTERERIAHLAESIRSAHDIAECAAPVEGETGRQECIDQWISICEEPDTWLRDLADDPEWLEAEFFEVWEIGYADGNGDNKAGTFTPNPYRSQE